MTYREVGYELAYWMDNRAFQKFIKYPTMIFPKGKTDLYKSSTRTTSVSNPPACRRGAMTCVRFYRMGYCSGRTFSNSLVTYECRSLVEQANFWNRTGSILATMTAFRSRWIKFYSYRMQLLLLKLIDDLQLENRIRSGLCDSKIKSPRVGLHLLHSAWIRCVPRRNW